MTCLVLFGSYTKNKFYVPQEKYFKPEFYYHFIFDGYIIDF